MRLQGLNYTRSGTSVTSKTRMSNISVKLYQIANKAPAHLKNIEVSDFMKGLISEISSEICTQNMKYFFNRFKNLDFEHVGELHKSFVPVRFYSWSWLTKNRNTTSMAELLTSTSKSGIINYLSISQARSCFFQKANRTKERMSSRRTLLLRGRYSVWLMLCFSLNWCVLWVTRIRNFARKKGS